MLGEIVKERAIEVVKRNAARDIITGIREWRENKVQVAKRRWIYELIQNAIDVAKARGNNNLKIEIFKDGNSIIFRHNGGFFTLDEIGAIIYGGSTKPYSQESEYIGRFGTGFLVTHILSRIVEINGYIFNDKDNKVYKFEIKLNRNSNDDNELAKDIDRCFEQLNKATLIGKRKGKEEYITEYRYIICDELGNDAIKEGLSELEKVIPLILAFNDIISEITINGKRFRKISTDNNIVKVERYTVILKHEGTVQIAIVLENTRIIKLDSIPKIFVSLPLVETADIDLPFVINSKNLEPTKERDFLLDTHENKEILDRAFKLYIELLNDLSSNIDELKDLHNLLNFSTIKADNIKQNPLSEYLDELIKEYRDRIIEEIPLVKTLDGYQEICNVLFPIEKIDDPDSDKCMPEDIFEEFYAILSSIKRNIPTKDVLGGWKEIALKLHEDSAQVNLYTIKDLRDEIVEYVKDKEYKDQKYPELTELRDYFSLPEDPKTFLIKIIKIIDKLYKINLIKSPDFVDYLLVDQNGVIGPCEWDDGQLYMDNNIPEDLKEIAKKIGWDIKSELLDNKFADFKIVQDLIDDYLGVDDVIEELINNEDYWTDEKVEEWNDKAIGWVELFRWCVMNDKLQKGFPIITKDERLQVLDDIDKESFIVPFKYMGIKEEFEQIYPESRIIHEKYFELDNDELQIFIEKLRKYKSFITKIPVYRNKLTLEYSKLMAILEDGYSISRSKHTLECKEPIISVIPFWNEVIGKISNDRDLAKLFFRFVIEHIMDNDDSWKKIVEVGCNCRAGKHRIIPSYWLASIKKDAWIPLKVKKGDEEEIVQREATKESFEDLFTQDELKELMKIYKEKIEFLLPHLGYDRLDLKIRLHSIETGEDERIIREKLSNFVNFVDKIPDNLIMDLMSSDPEELEEILSTIKEKKEEKEIKSKNKRIGEFVEKVIENIIKEEGFNVNPVYVGGDLEIWPEQNEGWDGGSIKIESLKESFYIEIKFTSSDRVRLSKRQSETARRMKDNYVVLVVENAGNLRTKLENAIERGSPDDVLKDLIDPIVKNSFVIEGIHTKLGTLPNPDEVEPDIEGYWLKRKLWKDGRNILEWLKMKFGSKTCKINESIIGNAVEDILQKARRGIHEQREIFNSGDFSIIVHSKLKRVKPQTKKAILISIGFKQDGKLECSLELWINNNKQKCLIFQRSEISEIKDRIKEEIYKFDLI